MACDIALCVFAEAVLEDDRTPGLGVRRGPDVEGQTRGERDSAVGWGRRRKVGFRAEGGGGGSHGSGCWGKNN